MNKSLAFSALGLGGTGASLTGAYALGMFEGSEAQVHRPALSGEYKDWWILNDLGNFKNQDPKDCVKKAFPGIEKGLEQIEGYQEWKVEESNPQNKDSNFSFSKDKDSNGCLTVVWERSEPKQKTEDNKNKYSGKFALLWSFSQGDKGFISHSRFNFDSTGNDGKAWASGLIYALEKHQNNKWKITAQYEVGKEGNSVIPKPGDVLSDIKDLDFWGLEGDAKKDKSNLVKKDEIGSEDQIEPKLGGSYWKWTGKNEGKSKITDWSSNLNSWWEELFKDCKNKILNKVKEITGEWEQVAIEWNKQLGEGG